MKKCQFISFRRIRDEAYGRFIPLLGVSPSDTRPDDRVEAETWVEVRIVPFEVDGGTAAGVTLGPPCVQAEFELGCVFCIPEVSLRIVPVAGSVLSYKNIKSCPWGTEVCHIVLLLVDTPSPATFNLKASPPIT